MSICLNINNLLYFLLLCYKITIISKNRLLKIPHSKTITYKENTESLQGESEVTRENSKYAIQQIRHSM